MAGGDGDNVGAGLVAGGDAVAANDDVRAGVATGLAAPGDAVRCGGAIGGGLADVVQAAARLPTAIAVVTC